VGFIFSILSDERSALSDLPIPGENGSREEKRRIIAG
jgi:hypothetical protein